MGLNLISWTYLEVFMHKCTVYTVAVQYTVFRWGSARVCRTSSWSWSSPSSTTSTSSSSSPPSPRPTPATKGETSTWEGNQNVVFFHVYLYVHYISLYLNTMTSNIKLHSVYVNEMTPLRKNPTYTTVYILYNTCGMGIVPIFLLTFLNNRFIILMPWILGQFLVDNPVDFRSFILNHVFCIFIFIIYFS